MNTVLILANHFVTIHLFRYELVQRLLSEGFKVVIAMPEDKDDCFKNLGCEIIKTDVDRHGINPLVDFKLFLKYLSIIKKVNPDVVLSYTVKPNIYGGIASRLARKPQIYNITGLGGGVKNKIIKTILTVLYRVALKNGECVFVQNRENKSVIESFKINYKKCELIPGSGVNLEKFVPLSYPDGRTVEFFYIARVMKDKGIEEYLAAAKYFKELKYDVNFHIFGFCEDDYEEELKKLENEGVIIYHGMCDNMAEQQKINHCTIHPSYHEGMSNVILESSACARPCICSDIPGCNDIVENGKNGILFESGSADALIAAIEKFLELSVEERAKMGQTARKTIEDKFDRNIVVDTYVNEIQVLIGRG